MFFYKDYMLPAVLSFVLILNCSKSENGSSGTNKKPDIPDYIKNVEVTVKFGPGETFTLGSDKLILFAGDDRPLQDKLVPEWEQVTAEAVIKEREVE